MRKIKDLVKEVKFYHYWLRNLMREFLETWAEATNGIELYINTYIVEPTTKRQIYLVAGEKELKIRDGNTYKDIEEQTYCWEALPLHCVRMFVKNIPDIIETTKEMLEKEITDIIELKKKTTKILENHNCV